MNNKETIFYLEPRGGMYLFHFFILNMGGLYYITNGKYNVRDNSNLNNIYSSDKIVSEPSNKITFPIKIHMRDILPFQREVFDIIKDKYELVEDLSQIENYEIVSIYGETCFNGDCDNQHIIYPFMRNLFLERIQYNIVPKKRIFITRKDCNVSGRHILNENELMPLLHKYDIEYIQLCDYTSYNKIRLFMESELIISTHSSALTLLLVANQEAKVIELVNGTKHYTGYDTKYEDMSSVLGLNYIKYSNITEDNNGSFVLDCNDFERFLQSHI